MVRNMKATRLAAALALLVVAIVFAGSVFLSSAALDRAAVGVTAVALLAGGVAALVGTAKVAYALSRYATTDPVTVDDVTSLPPGEHWVRVEGRARAEGDCLEPPLSSEPAVAQSVTVSKQETLSGLSFLPTFTNLVDATETRPFSVVDGPFRFRVDADDSVMVLDSWTDGRGATVRANDDAPPSLREFCDRYGHDVDAHRSDGYVFDHDLRVAEATVPDGETVRLFGRVSVAEHERAVEPRGEGPTAVVATAKPWRTIPARYCRDLVWGIGGTATLFVVGTALFASVLGLV